MLKKDDGRTYVILDFNDICEALTQIALKKYGLSGKIKEISGFYLDDDAEVKICIAKDNNEQV